MRTLYLNGFGYHFPSERIGNRYFAELVDTTEEWIVDHIGIEERRRATPETDSSDLGVRALNKALVDGSWEQEELDVLICATSTPDALVPSTACYIANKMALDAVAFDLNAACSGFVFGLSVLRGLFATGYERGAIVAAEKYTKVANYKDRTSCIFFGDGAGAVLASTEKPARGLELVDVILQNCNTGADMVNTPIGGHFRQHGASVKTYAMRWFAKSARDMLERHDLAASDLRAFMGHQANMRVLEEVCEKVGIREDQHWHNIRFHGNQGAAGVATTLTSGILEHRDSLRDGDLFLLTVFGAGFTTGSALLRWIDQERS